MLADRLNRQNVFRNTLLFGTAGILILVANIMVVLGGLFYENAACTMFAANIVLNVAVVFELCKHIRRDFPMLIFTASYDLLLLGRVYVAFFSDYKEILYDLQADNFQNLFWALEIVTLAYLFVYAAYQLSAPLFLKKEKSIRTKGMGAVRRGPLIPIIRQLSELILFVSSIAFFFVMFQTVLNVWNYGYLGSFTHKADSNIPSVISRISFFFPLSFAVFLATMPSRKQMKVPLILYAVYMLSSLFTGRRNTFVCEALMLLIYFVLRDSLLPKEKRVLKKKIIFWILVCGVIAMYLLQMMAEVRTGNSAQKRGFLDSIVNFVYSQGASFRVVMQTVNCWDMFDHRTAYQFLFYPFEQFVHNNVVISTIFGLKPIVETQSMQFVLSTHNFAHVLTFMVDPGRYLSGGGFGTSFVAEAYVAYGMGGVAVISAMIGVVFRFFSSLLTRSWPVIALSLLAVKDFVFIPRNFALSWVTNVFSVTYLCYFIGIYLVALLAASLYSHIRVVPLQLEEAEEVLEAKT